MEFDINDIANVGSVRDVPAYQLPPEVWTLALNIRYADDGLQTLDGWERVFNSPVPIIDPHFAYPVSTATAVWWPYVSLTAAAVWNGSSHTNITRLSGAYTATQTFQWNGTMLGEILILNNGNDVPQAWIPPFGVGTKLVDLPNWPTTKVADPNFGTAATYRAKVIRALGSFLVAGNITETVTVPAAATLLHEHRVWWSHPAKPGEVPPTWVVQSTTNDAGWFDLPDVASGILVDILPLSNIMYVYKEASIWKMRFVGGQSIFDFGQSAWITTAGLLSQRCVCVTGDGTKHVLATQDDIIWHNGSQVQSILNKRQRKRLQDEIDTSNFDQSFMFANPFNNEVWFCYPSQGKTFPDKALLLNYRFAGGNEFTVTEADGITFRNAIVGTIEAFNPETWDDGPVPDPWTNFTGPWSTLERRRLIACAPDSHAFFKMGVGTKRDGVPYLSILQREGLGLIGKKRDGGPIVDHQRMKMLTRIWPKIVGGSVNIRFGQQMLIKGPTLWGGYRLYDPLRHVYCDPLPVTGRAVGFEINQQDVLWRIDGYKINVEPLGQF